MGTTRETEQGAGRTWGPAGRTDESSYWFGKQILVTGGTGFIGEKVVSALLNAGARRVVSYSRRWDLSEGLQRKLNFNRNLRIINGCITDREALRTALSGIDVVIHAAAYKSVPSCAYNPSEAVRVNVHGSETLFRACIEVGVKQVLAISTDKACLPHTFYGMTKALMEGMAVQFNNLSRVTRFSCARYGNVIGSTGSVIPLFTQLHSSGQPLTLVDPDMTRFYLQPHIEALPFVLRCARTMKGGEIFIPKMKAAKTGDIARYFDAPIQRIPYRPSEKMHEDIIAPHEVHRVYDCGWAYMILPEENTWGANLPEAPYHSLPAEGLRSDTVPQIDDISTLFL